MIKNILNRIHSFSVEEKQQFFLQEKDNLTQYMPELIQILQSSNKPLWPIAIQTIAAIGYPHNELAIPVLVEHLCDGNWLGWEDAVKCLATISPSVVIPFLMEIILDEGKNRVYWKDDVEEFCLALPQMGMDFLMPCLPSLVYLFSKNDVLHIFDGERFFFMLRPLQPRDLEAFVPILLQVLKEEGKGSVLYNLAYETVKKVPQPTFDLYKHVLSI